MNEHHSRSQWLGLFLGLVGVTIAIGGSFGAVPFVGFILSLASVLSIVTATLMAKRIELSLPLLPTLGVQCIVSSVLFFMIAFFEGEIVPETNYPFWFAVIWFMSFSTIGAYGFYWACLKLMPATKVSNLIYLTPPVTSVWAYFVFGQEITHSIVIAFLVCIVGVWMANRSTRVTSGE